MNRRTLLPAVAALILSAGSAGAQTPADTGWTYQGKLTDAGSPANGAYDLRFSCYLDDQGTIQSGPTLDMPGVAVDHGLFTTRLDFGAQFTGYKNWLLIEVSPAGAGTYTALPLQEITSAPQSLFSLLPWAPDAFGVSYTGGFVGINGPSTNSYWLTLHSPTGNYGFAQTDGNITFSTFIGGGGNGAYVGTTSDHPLHFYTHDSGPLMTVATSGYVGVGTPAPAAKFHTYDSVSVTNLVETGGGTNAWAKTTYKNANGSWDVGTSRGFNGDSFYIARAGAPSIAFSITPASVTQVHTLQILGGSDLAEPFDVAGAAAEPGMVVVIDEKNPGDLRLTDRPYDGKVAGVISGANGLEPGMVMQAEGHEHAEGKCPVAMTGRVWCWCDASTGPIVPGDRLTTSATPGHAMKADDAARAPGAVIGKAMTELKEGKGLVLVLVNLQ